MENAQEPPPLNSVFLDHGIHRSPRTDCNPPPDVRLCPRKGVHFSGGSRLPNQRLMWHLEVECSADASRNHPGDHCEHHTPGLLENAKGFGLTWNN